jgi:hypothetical protein
MDRGAAGARRVAARSGPIESIAVKRLLLIVMLALLPLQSVWASAARYCEHEREHEGTQETATPQHVGHHEHEHAAPTTASLPDNNGTHADLDCTVCHLACCASLLTHVAFELPLLSTPLCERAGPGFRSCIASIPDRPDIAGMAIAVRSGGVHIVC